MTVIVIHGYSQSLAGKLSRWMLQVSPGVFVADLTLRVSTDMKELAKRGHPDGWTWIHSTSDTEQGLHIETFGNTSYSLEDFDGLPLILKRKKRSGGKSPMITEGLSPRERG